MSLWGNNDGKTARNYRNCANGTVTGTSTAFTTGARVGDYIRAGGEDYLITAIASNTTQLLLGVPGATLSVVSSGASYTLSEKCKYVTTVNLHQPMESTVTH